MRSLFDDINRVKTGKSAAASVSISGCCAAQNNNLKTAKNVKLFGRISEIAASPRLTVGILFYSVLLVFVATLAQTQIGVERAAQTYFESFFAIGSLGGVKFPFVGGAAVGVLAVVNIVFSILKYLSFDMSGFGNSVVHCAIVLLIFSGALQYFMREEGRLSVREGAASNAVLVERGGVSQIKHLPFSLKLLGFERENWKGSDIPKSFASKVVFIHGNSNTEALIEMNSPASFMGWTFYQSSYADDGKTSILTAVRNPARMLPWLSVFAAFFGMVIAFAAKFWRTKK